MISAGRVLLMPKGEYNAATTYELLDLVSYNGSSYVAKGTTTGNLPTNTTYWQVMANGAAAVNVSANFATVESTEYASTSYGVGDFLVNHESKLCRVTAAILQGSEIIVNTNVELVSVTELIREVEESIAPIETKVATYSHAAGECFWLSDVLYKATTAIAVGDTLTGGVNITPAEDVCTQISELASDTDTAIQGVKDLLAPSEDGSTAVLSYSIGDEFIRNGALCKAKTAITGGDTLVLNTNYEDAGVAMDQLVSVKTALSNEAETRATLGAHNFYSAGNVAKTSTTDVYKSVEINKIPAGSYKLSALVTTTSGANKCNVSFRDSSFSGIVTVALGANSGSRTEAEVTLTQDAYAMYFYPADNASSPTETATFTDILVRLAIDPNPNYTPYAKTNQQLTQETTGLLDNAFANDAVNMLPIDFTSQVVSGITFTVNSDGTIKANGTATDTIDVLLHRFESWETMPLKKMTGCPSGGSTSTYYLRWIRAGAFDRKDTGDGAVLDAANTAAVEVRLIILSGVSVSNIVFKPMISFAMLGLNYNDYVPYAMTNRELTDLIKKKALSGTSQAGGQFAVGIPSSAVILGVDVNDYIAFPRKSSSNDWYIYLKTWDLQNPGAVSYSATIYYM